MSQMAYRASMYLIMFNIAMAIMNMLATYFAPYDTTRVATSVIDFNYLYSLGNISLLVVGAAALASFIFGFLAITLAFVIGLYAISGILTLFYISALPIPDEFKNPFYIITGIIYIAGIAKYAGRSDI